MGALVASVCAERCGISGRNLQKKDQRHYRITSYLRESLFSHAYNHSNVFLEQITRDNGLSIYILRHVR